MGGEPKLIAGTYREVRLHATFNPSSMKRIGPSKSTWSVLSLPVSLSMFDSLNILYNISLALQALFKLQSTQY